MSLEDTQETVNFSICLLQISRRINVSTRLRYCAGSGQSVTTAPSLILGAIADSSASTLDRRADDRSVGQRVHVLRHVDNPLIEQGVHKGAQVVA